MKFEKVLNELKPNKVFWFMIVLIFVLHIMSFPSIHHIDDDEGLYLNISKAVCQGDMSYYIEPQDRPPHGPLVPALLCFTSPIHGFDIDLAGILSFMVMLFMVVAWSLSIPKIMNIDKRKLAILLFANNLIWIYATRALLDVPLACFLSLGILHLYLFFRYNNRKNYIFGFVFTTLALLVREEALIFIPVIGVYLLVKNLKNIRGILNLENVKRVLMLLAPLIPYILFLTSQYVAGYDTSLIFNLGFKPTRGEGYTSFESIPYANFPVIVYMTGTFGIGLLSVVLLIKNRSKLDPHFKEFMMFFLIMYVIWELLYDLVVFASLPRYHITLIPFFTLLISQGTSVSKTMKYIYYITLVYVLLSGFSISYYYHVDESTFWQYSIKEFIKTVTGIKF